MLHLLTASSAATFVVFLCMFNKTHEWEIFSCTLGNKASPPLYVLCSVVIVIIQVKCRQCGAACHSAQSSEWVNHLQRAQCNIWHASTTGFSGTDFTVIGCVMRGFYLDLPKRKLRTISITQLSALGQSRPFCEEALSGKLTQHSSAVLAVADSFLRLRLLAHTCDSEERNSFGLSPTSVTVLFSSSHRLQLLHRVIRTEVEKSYSNAGLCWSACVRRWWVIKLSPVWPWCVTALRIFITIPID